MVGAVRRAGRRTKIWKLVGYVSKYSTFYWGEVGELSISWYVQFILGGIISETVGTGDWSLS